MFARSRGEVPSPSLTAWPVPDPRRLLAAQVLIARAQEGLPATKLAWAQVAEPFANGVNDVLAEHHLPAQPRQELATAYLGGAALGFAEGGERQARQGTTLPVAWQASAYLSGSAPSVLLGYVYQVGYSAARRMDVDVVAAIGRLRADMVAVAAGSADLGWITERRVS